MSLRIYNVLSRQKEEFVPLTPGRVNIYVCGPTVYDYSHIGHAKTDVRFDVVVRYFVDAAVRRILAGTGYENRFRVFKGLSLDAIQKWTVRKSDKNAYGMVVTSYNAMAKPFVYAPGFARL